MQYYHERLSGRIMKPPRIYPTDNYLSGDGKSTVWPTRGSNFYVPSERRFIKYHDVKHLPPERRADQKEYMSEDEWRAWQAKRDAPPYYPNGLKLTNMPPLRLDGYCMNPFNLHRTGVQARSVYNPKPDLIDPTWRGPHGYYGYYHERLDSRDTKGIRLYKQLYNDEDWLKWEQYKTLATKT